MKIKTDVNKTLHYNELVPSGYIQESRYAKKKDYACDDGV
jgi:hypothetical protein